MLNQAVETGPSVTTTLTATIQPFKEKPLVEMGGAEKIHFSSCMTHLCPFINKYKTVISAKYPDVELVMGTDNAPWEAILNKDGQHGQEALGRGHAGFYQGVQEGPGRRLNNVAAP